METLKRFKIFQAARAEIEDPHKAYENVLLELNGVARNYLGMDALYLDFSFVNPRFIALLIIMTTFMYADIEAAILSGDVGGFAYNIAVLGFGVQGFAKFDAYVYRKKLMQDLLWRGSAFMERNKGIDRLREILIDNATVILLLKRFYFKLYGTAFTLIATFGIIVSIISGERLLTFGYQFSFLDTSEWLGYCLTYFYQVLGLLMVIISSCCNDILMVAVYVGAMAMYDCIMSDLRELSKVSQLEKTLANKRIAKDLMNSIIKQHQDVLQLLNLSNDVYSSYFLMSLACMTGTLAILLIALVWVRWYAAIVICVVASSQIFTLCLLGTLLLMKSDDLIVKIYATTWYDLDLPVQKSLSLMLMNSQHFKEISYRLGVMNMETFLQSHKMIYRFFTMLVTMHE
ncbi:putative odorant receptor 83c [Armigeres subalbatus]|uniref:putative odorant receptor 83c n=1 Tax=Armigeres subalbatus TaxID=124917 RepID=UPI002ED2C374